MELLAHSLLKKSRGFTLIEVMISLTVLGMIAVSLWAATSQTTRTRDIVETAQERHHEVRVAFDMMTRDLGSTFLSQHRANVDPTHDAVFVATDRGDQDRLDFAAFSHTRRFFDVNESDQAEISYYLDDDPELSGVTNLIRRESPVLDEKATEGGQILILLKDVVTLDFEFYDAVAAEWKSEWDTTQATGEGSVLPFQVRIKLVVNERKGARKIDRSDEEYRKITYGTQVGIPIRQAIWAKPFIPGPPIPVQ